MSDHKESIGPPPWRALRDEYVPSYGGSPTILGDKTLGDGNGQDVWPFHMVPETMDGHHDLAVAQEAAEKEWRRAEPRLGPGGDESRQRAREEARAAEAARPKRTLEETLALRRHYVEVAEGRSAGTLDALGRALLRVSEVQIQQNPEAFG